MNKRQYRLNWTLLKYSIIISSFFRFNDKFLISNNNHNLFTKFPTGVLTSLSTDILKRKADVLRGRIWKIATASAVGALVPLPGLSIAVDLPLIASEVNFYKSQLGLPDENSHEFNMLTPSHQEKVRQLCFTSATQLATIMATYATSSTVEEFARFVPVIGSAITEEISFCSTYFFLRNCVSQMESVALGFLDQVMIKYVDNLDLD
ncbi:uncharacterized protein LOC124438055 [Xenia sp. Carnegie-2017]|uniref:uncharacterized protein LOC124438055 n=1 Tax=Xenia sp. Carnegie-2017 TaxID=2897299 RepID=UPI001F0331FD|nr:uncharacterized protein LOC124438055 [Xenia sp. Carnegie-2017]